MNGRRRRQPRQGERPAPKNNAIMAGMEEMERTLKEFEERIGEIRHQIARMKIMASWKSPASSEAAAVDRPHL